ncbi:MAG: proton-conducting transporter membrane subunit [Dehalococcoidia bacterium]
MTGTFSSLLPLIAVLIPAAGATLVALTGERQRNVRDAWSTIAGVALLTVVFVMLPDVLDGRVPETMLIEIAPGIDIVMRADPAGMIFALLASALWVLAGIYAVGYMRGLDSHKQTRFFTSFALSIAATMGIAFSGNLLTFIIFYELLSLLTYPLVIHNETEHSAIAGRQYLVYTLSGGLMLIGAAAWLHVLGIPADFTPGGFLAGADLSDPVLWVLFGLLATGMAVKAAVMPLHSWLPMAMVAPTPVSALLHAVAVVKAGVFGVVRVLVFVFGATLLQDLGAWIVLASMSGATLIIASLLALRHDNLKRRLAYSTVSHLSYIVLGIALIGPIALVGALLHIVGHGVTKITLFFCAGAIHVHTHKENVSELNGIGWKMPFTMLAFALASLSMAGIPPFVLFTSKFYLGWGAAEVGQQAFMVLYMVSGVLSAGYLFPVVIRAFRDKPADFSFRRVRDADPRMVAPLFVTGVVALLWGIFPDSPFQFFQLAEGIAQSAFSSAPVAGGTP